MFTSKRVAEKHTIPIASTPPAKKPKLTDDVEVNDSGKNDDGGVTNMNNKRKAPASDDDGEKSSKRKALASDDNGKGSNTPTKSLRKEGTAPAEETVVVHYRKCLMVFEETLYDGKFSGEIVDGKDWDDKPIRWASGRGTFIFDENSPCGLDGFRLTATGFGENDDGEVCGIGRLVRADGTLKYVGGFMAGWFDGRGTKFEDDGVTPRDGGDGYWEYATHGIISCIPLRPGARAPRSIPEAGEPGHDVHVDNDDDSREIQSWVA